MDAGRGFKLLKWFVASLGGFAAPVGLFGLYLYVWVIPKSDIHLLMDGYVATTYQEPDVAYAFVRSQPSDWTPLADLPEEAQAAILVAEDWRFYHHPGYDIQEIKNALMDALRDRDWPRGASTIPQQVSKNLFLDHDYSVWRKIKELAIALYMEHALTKDQILEIYVNTIEYGEGVYGIAEASAYYFGKEPSMLTPKEAAFLATILPNPKGYSRALRESGLPPRVHERVTRILKIMRGLGKISEEEYEAQLEAPLVFTPQATGAPFQSGWKGGMSTSEKPLNTLGSWTLSASLWSIA